MPSGSRRRSEAAGIAGTDGPGGTEETAESASVADRGAVTVEGAITLSMLVFVFSVVLVGISAVVDQLRCIDAAASAARLIARGDPEAGRRAVEAIAPESATFESRHSGRAVVVTIRAAPAGGLLPVTVKGTAYAAMEPGVADGPA